MTPKCCGFCGRWGNRAYVWNYEREEWVCTNDRACKNRVRAALTTEGADEREVSR